MPSDQPVPWATSLGQYVDLLLQANTETNLVSRQLSRDAVLDFADACTEIVALADAPQQGSYIDVGSGGGLPGIPLALAYPDLTTILCEPRRRRVEALQAFVERVPVPNAQVAGVKAFRLPEVAGSAVPAQLVTAFGVGKPGVIIPLVSELLAADGVGVISAPSSPSAEELDGWETSAEQLGHGFEYLAGAMRGPRSLIVLR